MWPGKPWTIEISQECLLCYDQSQRSGDTNYPQNHRLIKVLACSSVFSYLIGFFSCNTITFQIYFWRSRFSWFDYWPTPHWYFCGVKEAIHARLHPNNIISRASDRSQKKKSNFARFLGTNSLKNRPILWLFSRQISLGINRLCADQTSVFNVFLTEVIICSFNNNTLQKWTNGKACLHVSVTKFQDKFASLRQVNSPYRWNKFQICCTDMYLIRFLPNFAASYVSLWISRDFADLPEFCSSATTRNIRSPNKQGCQGL